VAWKICVIRSRMSWTLLRSRSSCERRSISMACRLIRYSRPSGSAPMLLFLNSRMRALCRLRSSPSRATSCSKKSSVCSARPVLSRTFSSRTRVTYSFTTVAVVVGFSAAKEIVSVVARSRPKTARKEVLARIRSTTSSGTIDVRFGNTLSWFAMSRRLARVRSRCWMMSSCSGALFCTVEDARSSGICGASTSSSASAR
jgi:hypothetical protein